ncbi:MAG: hypothetical protein HY763_12860 [Planctomycetes bacterium]|nr:hypothetical protein [Planctomycetota bacterium]
MITHLLFESLWLLAAGAATVELVLIAVWSRRRSPGSARVATAGLAAIPLLMVISAAVETPREEVTAFCGELAMLVEHGDLAGIERRLAPEIEVGGLGRDELLARLKTTLTRYHVSDPHLHGFEVAVPRGAPAVARFDALCRVRGSELVYEWLPSRWRLTLRRGDSGWLVAAIESLPVPPLNLEDPRDWLR